MFFKDRGKIAAVVKAKLHGGVRDGVAFQQQFFCIFHLALVDIGAGRDPHNMAELLLELGGGQMHGLCQIVQKKLLRNMLPDIHHNALNVRGAVIPGFLGEGQQKLEKYQNIAGDLQAVSPFLTQLEGLFRNPSYFFIVCGNNMLVYGKELGDKPLSCFPV